MSNFAAFEEERVNELALSIAWHAGMTRSVTTNDGDDVSIVFPGHWTHGDGPDFRGAMLEFPGGRLVTGSVELHHHASDWSRHNHHTDANYNDVVLHIVSEADVVDTRRLDGSLVPIAILRIPQSQLTAVQSRNPAIWSQFGGSVCAPHLTKSQPDRVRTILWHLGDERFEQRVVRFESELASYPPGSVLVRSMFEAFGYSRNRDQMLLLADRFDWIAFAHRLDHVERDDRVQRVLATLLGLSGWMPISPQHADIAGLGPDVVTSLERLWKATALPEDAGVSAAIWDTARIRPANHPVSRVATLSAMLGSHGSMLAPMLLDAIRDELSVVSCLQELAQWHTTPPLGEDRAIAITTSVVLPFAAAYARATGDDGLEDAAARIWSNMPSGSIAQPARRARQQVGGKSPLRGLKERGNQGLLYLDRAFCNPRRCYECPIARAVVADDLARQSSSPYTDPPSTCS